ncbi:MAG: DNA polymerase IV [Deltaproteobacteria bacterium]|nr:DNA polymerase IV [Deltaproteobacteria bacterium]
MQKRAVIHIYLDAFFVSVEVKRRPGIKGRPIVVGADGDPEKRGAVSAASYDARAFGVDPGMTLKKARKLCPEAVFLPVDFESYEKESERFFSILMEYSPIVESFGLDEAFIEVLPHDGGDPFPHAIEIAGEIKKRVDGALGLSSSVGVAPNKLLARLAGEMDKPGGLYVLMADEAGRILKDLPVARLRGVGQKTGKRLNGLGIYTVGEISKTPLQYLERNFGSHIGKALYEHSRGIDQSPVVPFHEPNALSREVVFEGETDDQYIIKETLYALAGDIVARLKGLGCRGKDVAIKISYSDFETVSRSTALDTESDSLNDIWTAALKLLDASGPHKPVRLVGVKVAGLKGRGAL